jgi:DNA processing protein
MERKFGSISLNDHNYPKLLKEIPRPPKQLFHVGSLPPSDMMAVAIVGTRKTTTQGTVIAKRLAHGLASRGIVIVSGLAIGIDTAAHEGAVEARGITMAVLADGVSTIYPSRNTALADKIISLGGAMLSEHQAPSPYYSGQFIERNRIISGICVATIVIEAPERSGTIATARFALEQGREVFVVPGPIDHPNYIGSHRLIRDGARLVTSAEDIYEDLALNPTTPPAIQSTLWESATRDEQLIISTLTSAGKPISVDKLAELTNMEARMINSTLASLVMSGAIKETEQGFSL